MDHGAVIRRCVQRRRWRTEPDAGDRRDGDRHFGHRDRYRSDRDRNADDGRGANVDDARAAIGDAVRVSAGVAFGAAHVDLQPS